MEITTGEIIAHHKKGLFEKINDKVYNVFLMSIFLELGIFRLYFTCIMTVP